MIITMFKAYLNQYSAVPRASWQRITVALMDSLAGGVAFFITLYFVNRLHFNIESADMLMSCYGLGTAIGGIAGGKLSDKFGAGIVSLISLLISALGFLILIKLAHEAGLILVMFVLGLTSYAFTVANNQQALSYCRQDSTQKLRVIAILYVCSNLGIGLSAMVVGWLSAVSFKIIFIFSALLLFCGAGFLLFLELYPTKEADFEKIQMEPDNREEQESQKQKINNKAAFYTALSCLFLLGLVVAQRSSNYPLYIQQIFPHLDLHWLGFLFMLNPLMVVFFQAPIVNLFRNRNKFLIMGLGTFLYGFGSFILSFASVYALAIVSCVILTIGEMLAFSTIQFISYESAGKGKKGNNLGLYQSTYAVSVIIGPTVGGMLYHYFGGITLWYISGLIGCVCLGICLYAARYIHY